MTAVLSDNDHIKDLPEFDKHSFVSYLYDNKSGMSGFVVIHRKSPGVPSFGATRIWNYTTDLDALKDALRLSKMMSYKAAVAGLDCGGAKAVILKTPDFEKNKSAILRAYADRINLLKDHFVTGTDVGLDQSDLPIIKERTPNIVGVTDNTSEYTALGIYYSMQCALKEVFGSGGSAGGESLSGRTFSIQGLGKIGSEVLKLIYPDAAKIYVSEIDEKKLAEIRKIYPKIIPVPPNDIYKQEVDVFSPSALGSILNSQSITELKCKIVVGGANNQLETESIGELLHKLGILYAPDYVVNAGGLICVYDEYTNSIHDRARVLEKVKKIRKTLEQVLERSKAQNKATNYCANDIAEEIFNGYL